MCASPIAECWSGFIVLGDNIDNITYELMIFYILNDYELKTWIWNKDDTGCYGNGSFET